MTLSAFINELTALRDAQRCGDLDVCGEPAPRRVGGGLSNRRIELYADFTTDSDLRKAHEAELDDCAERIDELECENHRLEKELAALKGKAKQ